MEKDPEAFGKAEAAGIAKLAGFHISPDLAPRILARVAELRSRVLSASEAIGGETAPATQFTALWR